jgi:hypothetical protein
MAGGGAAAIQRKTLVEARLLPLFRRGLLI